MAGEYDEKFGELSGLVQKVIGRVDEMRLEMRDMRLEMSDMRLEMSDMHQDLRMNTTRLGSLENKVSGLSAQFTDVAGMAIKDHPLLEKLEKRVDILEAEVH